jgi:hypothetical protein
VLNFSILCSGIHTAHENTEIRPNENNTTQTLEQNSLNLTQQADLEVEDEASELALREQLLKSIVTKRAAKNAGKVNEKSTASSVASPNNSRAPSPFAEPGTRKGLQEVVKSEATKAAKVLYTCMDLFPNEQNFDLDKSRQTFHHRLKEHHKISNMPKFRCEML